jgi:hypothetical protein
MPKPSPRPSFRAEVDELRGVVADVQEELAAARSDNPLAHWENDPEGIGAVMARRNSKAFRRLVEAGRKVLDDDSP